ncbi:MAG: hypothetical protein OEZ36_00695 [Spirochaetota bacterium]|nr:hypothetical protein [Spirochaetota bacterium]
MNPSQILAIRKFSKLEYDSRKYSLDTASLIDKYKREQVDHDIILQSHEEQMACINLAKKLLPEATFISTPELNKELTQNKSLIISIGGDEHFKYVIHSSIEGNLVLNVRSDNLKSEGALSSCNRLNLEDMVRQILSDSYLTEEWVRLEAQLNDKPIESAIDTIYIGEKNSTRMSRYLLNYKGQTEEQKSSGLLIVTGAGSTGWFSSAGGHSFPRDAETGKFIAREIYKGTVSGYLLDKGDFTDEKDLFINSLMDDAGIVEIDSIKEYIFKRGDRLRVHVSKNRLRVMVLNPEA